MKGVSRSHFVYISQKYTTSCTTATLFKIDICQFPCIAIHSMISLLYALSVFFLDNGVVLEGCMPNAYILQLNMESNSPMGNANFLKLMLST